MDQELPAHWSMKHRLKGLYIDLIELLQKALGFADYEVHLFSREEYFNRNQNSKDQLLKRKQEKLAVNHRLVDEHIDFVIGELSELANELNQIHEPYNEQENIKIEDKNKNLKLYQTVPIQSFLSLPISALFIRNSLCIRSSSNSIDHLFCSNQLALYNETYFKVFDSTLWTLLVACYLSISLLMYLIVNFGNSFTYTLTYCPEIKEKLIIRTNKSTKEKLKNEKPELIKSTLKEYDDHFKKNHQKLDLDDKDKLNRTQENINEVSNMELPDNHHLSSSTPISNEQQQLVFCGQTGNLRLVELGMNLYGTLNNTALNSNTNSNTTNSRPTLLSEHQLITMNPIVQNQLDVYQFTGQQQLNEKHQATLLQTVPSNNIQNEANLILHSNLNSLNASTVTTIDHLNNTLNDNIELINNSFGQSVFNIDNDGQLSPYLDLNAIKDDQTKQNLIINTLLTEKYPISNSLLIHNQLTSNDCTIENTNLTNNNLINLHNQLSGQISNIPLNNQFNQTKQYSPFVQFQLLNDSVPDHQSIIISSVSSQNSTRSQQSTNDQQQQFTNIAQSNDNSINKKINKKDQHLDKKSSTSLHLIKTMTRDRHYYRNSIELSTCFWYTIAIACHQKVPFKQRWFVIFLISYFVKYYFNHLKLPA